MAIITIPYTFAAGAVIIASQHNLNFNTIYNDYNGNIDNTNLASAAAIAYSKLNLTGNIVNADINASAAIANSKLNLSNITGTFNIGTPSIGRIFYDNGTNIIGLTAGTSGFVLTSNGTGVAPSYTAKSGIPQNIQTYTSGTSLWIKPAGVSTVYVKAYGPGGAAGDDGGGSHGAGGGGGYAEGLISVTGNVVVTVGITGTSGNPGTSATATTFAGVTTLTANGGGSSSVNNGGAGGTASNGSINTTGQAGISGAGSSQAGGYAGGPLIVVGGTGVSTTVAQFYGQGCFSGTAKTAGAGLVTVMY